MKKLLAFLVPTLALAAMTFFAVTTCSVDGDNDCVAHGGHMLWEPTGKTKLSCSQRGDCRLVPVWDNTCAGAQP